MKDIKQMSIMPNMYLWLTYICFIWVSGYFIFPWHITGTNLVWLFGCYALYCVINHICLSRFMSVRTIVIFEVLLLLSLMMLLISSHLFMNNIKFNGLYTWGAKLIEFLI